MCCATMSTQGAAILAAGSGAEFKQTVVITGASRGIGLEFARQLLQAGGELCDAKLGDKVRLEKTLSRITYDAIQYVHARATAVCEDAAEVVLELQSSDQTLAGKPLRGCGLVYCRKGRALFEKAVSEARAGSSGALD